MNAIDKMMKSIHEDEKTFEDIPLAKDVKTQSHTFDKEEYLRIILIKTLFNKISHSIQDKESYFFEWFNGSREKDKVKIYLTEIVPTLLEKGYNIIMIQNIEQNINLEFMTYGFYVIWDNYEFLSTDIIAREEKEGGKITVFESKVKE